jgi:hypothetical protein
MLLLFLECGYTKKCAVKGACQKFYMPEAALHTTH